MFKLFKSDPIKKLRKSYSDTLTEAMQAQRNGNIRLYSELTAKAEQTYQEIKALEESKT